MRDTWGGGERENMGAYRDTVEEDERVFEDQARAETAGPKRCTLETSTAGEPLGFAPVALNISVGLYALSKSTSSECFSSTLTGLGTPGDLPSSSRQSYEPLEDLYEHYERRMNRLYTALDMPYIRIDEATYRSNSWDAEITSQICS